MADEHTPITVDVTNNDRGPRYVHTLRGMEVLQTGDTLSTVMSDAQITAAEEAVIENTDDLARFTIERTDGMGTTDGNEGRALKDYTVPKLRKLADAEGADVGDLRAKTDIILAIEAHREKQAGTQQG